jgi:hypothetical protein
MFNIKDFKVAKEVFAKKKIVEPPFREETSLARNLSSNRRIIF